MRLRSAYTFYDRPLNHSLSPNAHSLQQINEALSRRRATMSSAPIPFPADGLSSGASLRLFEALDVATCFPFSSSSRSIPCRGKQNGTSECKSGLDRPIGSSDQRLPHSNDHRWSFTPSVLPSPPPPSSVEDKIPAKRN